MNETENDNVEELEETENWDEWELEDLILDFDWFYNLDNENEDRWKEMSYNYLDKSSYRWYEESEYDQFLREG